MVRSGVLWSLALSLFLALMGPRPTLGQSPPDSKTLRDTVALSQDGDVDISDTHHGRITVTTWGRAQVAYEAILTPEDTASAAPVSNPQIDPSDERFALDQDGNSWTINIPGLLRISPGREQRLEGDYRITMPKAAALEIDDHNSTIEVSGVEGDVEVNTREGEAVVDSVRGTPELNTYTGTIEATALRGGVALETHTGKASIAFDEFSASSEVETHDGTVRLFLPPDAGFTLQTDTTSTGVTIDDSFGTPSTNKEEQRFNGGGPELLLDTYSGTIELRPLDARKTATVPQR